MRLGALIALSFTALTLAACAASEPREAIDPSSDPAWQPPGKSGGVRSVSSRDAPSK